MSINNNSGHGSNNCMPNILLKSCLRSSAVDLLNVCHFNACSINPKIDEIRSIFSEVNMHIICISETWLKAYRSNKSLELTGYKMFRNDRTSKRGGGVCIYVKKNIRSRIISKSTKPNSIKFISVELLLLNSKVLRDFPMTEIFWICIANTLWSTKI